MSWMKEVIGTEKPIIAMCHLQAMPGDPHYDKGKGMKYVLEAALYRKSGDVLPQMMGKLPDEITNISRKPELRQ